MQSRDYGLRRLITDRARGPRTSDHSLTSDDDGSINDILRQSDSLFSIVMSEKHMALVVIYGLVKRSTQLRREFIAVPVMILAGGCIKLEEKDRVELSKIELVNDTKSEATFTVVVRETNTNNTENIIYNQSHTVEASDSDSKSGMEIEIDIDSDVNTYNIDVSLSRGDKTSISYEEFSDFFRPDNQPTCAGIRFELSRSGELLMFALPSAECT